MLSNCPSSIIMTIERACVEDESLASPYIQCSVALGEGEERPPEAWVCRPRHSFGRNHRVQLEAVVREVWKLKIDDPATLRDWLSAMTAVVNSTYSLPGQDYFDMTHWIVFSPPEIRVGGILPCCFHFWEHIIREWGVGKVCRWLECCKSIGVASFVLRHALQL